MIMLLYHIFSLTGQDSYPTWGRDGMNRLKRSSRCRGYGRERSLPAKENRRQKTRANYGYTASRIPNNSRERTERGSDGPTNSKRGIETMMVNYACAQCALITAHGVGDWWHLHKIWLYLLGTKQLVFFSYMIPDCVSRADQRRARSWAQLRHKAHFHTV